MVRKDKIKFLCIQIVEYLPCNNNNHHDDFWRSSYMYTRGILKLSCLSIKPCCKNCFVKIDAQSLPVSMVKETLKYSFSHVFNFFLKDIQITRRVHLLSIWDKMQNTKTFLHDYAPCHRAKKVTQWLLHEGIELIYWPNYSPDINPIFKRKLWEKKILSLPHLKSCIKEVWCTEITLSLIHI